MVGYYESQRRKKKGGKDWPRIASLLKKYGLEYQEYFTTGRHDAIDIARDRIIVGMITAGTGNDWGRMYRIPRDYESAIRTILEKKISLQDAGVVNYIHEGTQAYRYFVNMAGIGFDAFVTMRSNRLKDNGMSCSLVYLYNILTSQYKYRHSHANVMVDEQQFKDHVFSISIGIGKYCGGGMMQTPRAVVDDGLFDVTPD